MQHTRSASMIVCRRCAMVTTVLSLSSVPMTSWRSLSVSRSTEAVASSRHTTLHCRRRALARQRSCLWPAEKFSPYSDTPMARSVTAGSICMRLMTRQSSSSVWVPIRSMLLRRSPWNMMGSCGMHVIDWRRRSRVMLWISTASRRMRPPVGSTSRQSATMSELLPLPVRPTMPILCPASTANVTRRSTSGPCGVYLISTFSNWSAPRDGQSGGASLTLPRCRTAPESSSGSMERYSSRRSIDTICVSISVYCLITHERSPVRSSASERVNPTSAAYVSPRANTAVKATTKTMLLPTVSRRHGSQRSQARRCV
mmetsp:Transcript_23537/g.76568  ORF Transcript_23537/g.76568 Transcript_23537/m.76568 type:complete len:313 (+) Transcript_23537:272-1210(+)